MKVANGAKQPNVLNRQENCVKFKVYSIWGIVYNVHNVVYVVIFIVYNVLCTVYVLLHIVYCVKRAPLGSY